MSKTKKPLPQRTQRRGETQRRSFVIFLCESLRLCVLCGEAFDLGLRRMTAIAPQQQEQSFLDPSVLARIGNLELLAKIVVEGFINGLHRSPHLGASTDFAEHRAYMPGDDIRRIDWKLYARSDRHYIKEYEADTNTNFNVILDVSPSMRYGANAETGRVSKLTYGCYLAASLVVLLEHAARPRRRSRRSTPISSSTCRRRRSICSSILHTLDRVEKQGRDAKTAPGKSTLLAPLRKLSETVRRRSLVLLISDLYEDPDAVLDALAHIRGRGNDVMVFHLLDSHEIDFSFSDSTNFIDMETGEKMPVIPEYLRKQYKEMVAEHSRALSKRIIETRAEYALFDTTKPLDGALFAYLLARQRIKRTR